MGVTLSTVQRMWLHEDVCRVHTSFLKPTLMEENKMSRMELALSFVDKNNTSKLKNMEDLIHIDEKWFYLTKDGQHFIIEADEEEPYRHVQHKSLALGLLLGWLKDGVLLWGSLTIVAEEIGVACSTISRLWQLVRGPRKQSLIITPEIALRNNSRAN